MHLIDRKHVMRGLLICGHFVQGAYSISLIIYWTNTRISFIFLMTER